MGLPVSLRQKRYTQAITHSARPSLASLGRHRGRRWVYNNLIKETTLSNGKGDGYRKVDRDKFDDNYDAIEWKSDKKQVKKETKDDKEE